LDEAVTKVNGKPIRFTLHDLRRSAATKMAEDLQIQSDTIELILNHAAHRTGIRGVYNRSQQTVAKSQALIAWAARVTAIVTGQQQSNVVPLRA
jgi:hypothetical protein